MQNNGRGRGLVVAESFESVIDSRDLGTTDTAPNGSPSTLQLHLVQSCSPNHGVANDPGSHGSCIVKVKTKAKKAEQRKRW